MCNFIKFLQKFCDYWKIMYTSVAVLLQKLAVFADLHAGCVAKQFRFFFFVMKPEISNLYNL